MKRRVGDVEEWNETQANCLTFKIEAADGKLRETDCADNRMLLRIVQSIPSPRAEPFKQWLAEVGAERIEEIDDPERLTARQRKLYLAKGFPEDWVETQGKGMDVHEDLKGSGKQGLGKRDNLRDHMSRMELVLTMLGEATAHDLHETRDSYGFTELQRDSHDAGTVAGWLGGRVLISSNRLNAPSSRPITSRISLSRALARLSA